MKIDPEGVIALSIAVDYNTLSRSRLWARKCSRHVRGRVQALASHVYTREDTR